jgi:exonuclease III
LLGGEFALHGRYVEVDLNIGTDGLTVASVYIQTDETGTDRQLEKERFMAALAHRMAMLTDRDAVVCGDWNIAHTENLTTVAFPRSILRSPTCARSSASRPTNRSPTRVKR